MSTKEYKLIYFNFRGRAEISRLLFDLAGVKYEDVQIEMKDWPAQKGSSLFGQLPMLEIKDGQETVTIAQSLSIARYLANEFGFAGKTNVEKAQVDMLVDEVQDISMVIFGEMIKLVGYPPKPGNTGLTEEMKPELDKVYHGRASDMLKLLEAYMSKHGGGGYLVGGALTYADLHLYIFEHLLTHAKAEVLAKFPLIKQHNEMIASNPTVAEFNKRFASMKFSPFF